MVTPRRTADTMSDAIALSSPNGRMSNRGKEAAQKKLGEALFGLGGLKRPGLPIQTNKRELLLREAAQCRDLAARGMRTRAFTKQANWCEAEANKLLVENKISPSEN